MQNKKAGVPCTITLARELYFELERLSNEKHLSKSAIITLALEKYVRAEKQEKYIEREGST